MRTLLRLVFVLAVGVLGVMMWFQNRPEASVELAPPPFSASLWCPETSEQISIVGDLSPETKEALSSGKLYFPAQSSWGVAPNDPWDAYGVWYVSIDLVGEEDQEPKMVISSVPQEHVACMSQHGIYDASLPVPPPNSSYKITPFSWWSIHQKDLSARVRKDGGNTAAIGYRSIPPIVTLAALLSLLVGAMLGWFGRGGSNVVSPPEPAR